VNCVFWHGDTIVGDSTDFNVREIIREVIAIDHPGTVRARDVFTRAERARFMDSMSDENRRLVRRYMPDYSDFFDISDLTDGPAEDPVQRLQAQLDDRVAAQDALISAIGNLQRRRKAELELSPEDAPATSEDAGLEEEFTVPSWYREIYPAGDKSGWFHSFGDYACSFVNRSDKQLVVSFDNLSQAGNEAYAREPWAQKFCADQGYSHLGVYAQVPTWFRDADLIAYLEKLRDDGFFKGFKNVAFVGTSMGAFGALCFSSLAPGANVIAFSPQTTLDEKLVPWESRFAKGRAADWSLPFSDAAEHTSQAENIYLVYDAFHEGDTAHIDRLSGPNLVRLKGFGLGHKSALVLNRMDVLKKIMEPQEFYRAIRGRKDIFLYRQTIEGYLNDRGNTKRARRFAAAFKRRRRVSQAA
jgi:pimeloyl-ACP methyl ester carboxylesterase